MAVRFLEKPLLSLVWILPITQRSFSKQICCNLCCIAVCGGFQDNGTPTHTNKTLNHSYKTQFNTRYRIKGNFTSNSTWLLNCRSERGFEIQIWTRLINCVWSIVSKGLGILFDSSSFSFLFTFNAKVVSLWALSRLQWNAKNVPLLKVCSAESLWQLTGNLDVFIIVVPS